MAPISRRLRKPRNTVIVGTYTVVAGSVVTTLVAWLAEMALLGSIRIGLPEVAGTVAVGVVILSALNWPSLSRLSRRTRLRELHTMISNELRVTLDFGTHASTTSRPIDVIRMERLRIVFSLHKLGIYSPHPDDTEGWKEFLTMMAAHSQAGDLRSARKAYSTPAFFYKWGSAPQLVGPSVE